MRDIEFTEDGTVVYQDMFDDSSIVLQGKNPFESNKDIVFLETDRSLIMAFDKQQFLRAIKHEFTQEELME